MLHERSFILKQGLCGSERRTPLSMEQRSASRKNSGRMWRLVRAMTASPSTTAALPPSHSSASTEPTAWLLDCWLPEAFPKLGTSDDPCRSSTFSACSSPSWCPVCTRTAACAANAAALPAVMQSGSQCASLGTSAAFLRPEALRKVLNDQSYEKLPVILKLCVRHNGETIT